MLSLRRCFWLAGIALILVSTVLAGTTGKVAGKVLDATTGEPLYGVNVLLEGTNLGAATSADGRYFILNVPPALYSVRAQYIGYAMTTIQNVRVTVDITTEVNFDLEMEALQGEQIIKVAERPLIEKKSTNERRIVRAEDLENLPVRDAQEIIALQTGAVKVGQQLHIRGGRREEVAYFIDGVYQVNDFNRVDRPESGEVSATALEEVSFQAGGFDAEYGSATAGLINMSTKIGGNEFEFSGELATDEFLSEREAMLGTYSYGQNIYNFNISGPLTQKLGYFINAERQFNRDRDPTAGSHPRSSYLGDFGEDGLEGTEDEGEGDGIRQYGEYEAFKEWGPLPKNWEKVSMLTGNLNFSQGALRLKLGGNYSNNEWTSWDINVNPLNRRGLYALESVPLWKSQTYAAYLRGTWAMNPNTLLDLQVSRFNDSYQNGNADHWENYFLYGLRDIPTAQLEELFGAGADETAVRDMLQSQYDDLEWLYENQDQYTTDEDGYLLFQPELSANGIEPRLSNAYAGFWAPGTIFGYFEKNETGYTGINADFKTQQGSHELRAGGELRSYLIRYYQIGNPERLASTFFNNAPVTTTEFTEEIAAGNARFTRYDSYDEYIQNYWFQAFKNAYAENIGYTFDGSEEIGTSVRSDRDGYRDPKVGGLYVQDKVELDDLIMNLGLRFDYISPMNMEFLDPALIVLNSQGAIAETVYKDENGEYSYYEPTYMPVTTAGDTTWIDTEGTYQLVEREPFKLLSPRLGFAFPVTDRTVFHAQYGKYVQQPQLNRLYLSYLRFSSNLSQGNYTTSGNPLLDPVRTTSYEVGFKKQLGDNASIDLTVFYKQLTDYVQVRNVARARPIVYAQFVNGDYGSIKGLSASFQLRRTGYVQAFVNYTLQYAGGTGSTGLSSSNIAWQDGNYPTYVSPLDFDQRHTGSINIDVRSTAKDRLPEAGANFLFTFGSGRRYTPTTVNSFVFPNTTDTPIAPLNSGVMPWVFNLDMKLDKNWQAGPMKFNTYLWVKNLTDRKNVRDVHDGTGQADYDGWFSTPEGETWLTNPDNNEDIYEMRMENPVYWEAPRTVMLGMRFYLDR